MEIPDASLTAQNKENVDFFIYRAKIEPCTRAEPHSHSSCPFLHPEEGCPRRDPRVYKYNSVFCYDLHNTKVCKRGANCPYSHNLFEYFLHPSRYRTRMCECGDKCKRELCFFAHSESELRERTAIKIHSGGRRSGRRHRAAMAMQQAGLGPLGLPQPQLAQNPPVLILQEGPAGIVAGQHVVLLLQPMQQL